MRTGGRGERTPASPGMAPKRAILGAVRQHDASAVEVTIRECERRHEALLELLLFPVDLDDHHQ